MEREIPPFPDPATIGRVLRCQPETGSSPDVFDYRLRNEHLGISMRLTVDYARRAAMLYLRGSNAFLGFVHLPGIEQVALDESKGEVTFLAEGALTSQLSVQSVGVFVVTRQFGHP